LCGGGFDFDSASLLAEIEVAVAVVVVVGTKELAVAVAVAVVVAEACTFACTSFRRLGYNDRLMGYVDFRVDRQRVKDLLPVWARR